MVVDDIDRTIVTERCAVRAHGLRTTIVTNNIREYGDAWRSRIAIDELFDLVVDSCEEGVRQRAPAIYLTTLERLGVTHPPHAVFLDDFAGNITTARGHRHPRHPGGPDPRPALADSTRSSAEPSQNSSAGAGAGTPVGIEEDRVHQAAAPPPGALHPFVRVLPQVPHGPWTPVAATVPRVGAPATDAAAPRQGAVGIRDQVVMGEGHPAGGGGRHDMNDVTRSDDVMR